MYNSVLVYIKCEFFWFIPKNINEILNKTTFVQVHFFTMNARKN